jgi:hypothetical protein
MVPDSHGRVTAATLKTSQAYRDWIDYIVHKRHLCLTSLLLDLLADWAAKEGLDPPPSHIPADAKPVGRPPNQRVSVTQVVVHVQERQS